MAMDERFVGRSSILVCHSLDQTANAWGISSGKLKVPVDSIVPFSDVQAGKGG